MRSKKRKVIFEKSKSKGDPTVLKFASIVSFLIAPLTFSVSANQWLFDEDIDPFTDVAVRSYTNSSLYIRCKGTDLDI